MRQGMRPVTGRRSPIGQSTNGLMDSNGPTNRRTRANEQSIFLQCKHWRHSVKCLAMSLGPYISNLGQLQELHGCKTRGENPKQRSEKQGMLSTMTSIYEKKPLPIWEV